MMADGYGHRRKAGEVGTGGGDEEEFQEEDVWAMLSYERDEGGGSSSSTAGTRKPTTSSSSGSHPMPPSTGARRQSGSRMIPRSTSSSSNTISRQSAPVNIPDWSKIYKAAPGRGDHNRRPGPEGIPYARSTSTASAWVSPAGGCFCDGYLRSDASSFLDDYDDGNGDDGAIVPPHEWLARKLAASQISSSMFEGVGRTLKGRDLRTVRNAVLNKTGFLDSD